MTGTEDTGFEPDPADSPGEPARWLDDLELASQQAWARKTGTPGDGVAHWVVTRIGLINALRNTWCGAVEVEMGAADVLADAILEQLPSVAEGQVLVSRGDVRAVVPWILSPANGGHVSQEVIDRLSAVAGLTGPHVPQPREGESR